MANDYDGLIQGTLSGKRLPEEEAKQFIAQAKGKRYDAQVVDAFLAVSGGLKEAPANALPLAPRDLAEGMVSFIILMPE